jgi:hypothetical protein
MQNKARWISVTTIIITVAASEAALRLLQWRIPAEAHKWPRREMAVKYEQMSSHRERDETFDVVFVGNSTTVNGIDPIAFSAATGLPSYNAAFAGGSLRSIAPWTIDVVEPALRPDVVVVGLQSRDLNDNGKVHRELFNSLMTSPGYRQISGGPIQRAEGWLERHSAFFRNRRALRRPAEVFRNATSRRLSSEHPRHGFVGLYGRRRGKEIVQYQVQDRWVEQQRTQTLNDYKVGGRELRALIALHRALRERGVGLILLDMPTTVDYIPLHPKGYRDVRRYRQVLTNFAAESEVPLLSAAGAFSGTTHFKDPVHLDAMGRSVLTRYLAAAWGEPKPRQGSPWCLIGDRSPSRVHHVVDERLNSDAFLAIRAMIWQSCVP